MSDLDDMVAEAFPLATGGYPKPELTFMCDTVETLRPDAVFEWGTGSGCSGRIFWECARILDTETTIHTIELPDELKGFDHQHPGEHCGMYLTPTTVIRHRGDGVTEALILHEQLRPERPLFFLDGDHSQIMVMREIALVERLVPGAWMLVHDTNGGPGVAGREWAARGRHVWSEVPDRVGIGLLEPVSA